MHFRYLQEIGYTDAILDVRSSRARSLLGLTSHEPSSPVKGQPAEQVSASHVNDADMVQGATSKPNSIRGSGITTKETNVVVKR